MLEDSPDRPPAYPHRGQIEAMFVHESVLRYQKYLRDERDFR